MGSERYESSLKKFKLFSILFGLFLILIFGFVLSVLLSFFSVEKEITDPFMILTGLFLSVVPVQVKYFRLIDSNRENAEFFSVRSDDFITSGSEIFWVSCALMAAFCYLKGHVNEGWSFKACLVVFIPVYLYIFSVFCIPRYLLANGVRKCIDPEKTVKAEQPEKHEKPEPTIRKTASLPKEKNISKEKKIPKEKNRSESLVHSEKTPVEKEKSSGVDLRKKADIPAEKKGDSKAVPVTAVPVKEPVKDVSEDCSESEVQRSSESVNEDDSDFILLDISVEPDDD